MAYELLFNVWTSNALFSLHRIDAGFSLESNQDALRPWLCSIPVLLLLPGTIFRSTSNNTAACNELLEVLLWTASSL